MSSEASKPVLRSQILIDSQEMQLVKLISRRTLLRMALTLAAALPASAILVSQSEAQTESVLYRFQGGSDGANPQASLIADSAGNLYGTTTYGGGSPLCVVFAGKTAGCGTVFELSPNSSGLWMETVLYRFEGGSDGGEPVAGLVMDGKGNLYGTTVYGGGSQCNRTGCGTVFQLTPPASQGGAWTEALLYSFQGGNDGSGPQGNLVFDQSGRLYGTTTTGGGSANCPANGGCGTIFQLAPPAVSGGLWAETVLYSFNGATGALPFAGLAFDKKGNLYGTTYIGGVGPSGGTVFRAIPPTTSGSWTVKVLHSFQRGNDGGTVVAGVILDAAGNVYGTTLYGGGGRCYNGGQFGCGTVFELSPPSTPSGAWSEDQIVTFPAGRDGRYPEGGLIFDGNGNLYGTTALGGGGGLYGDVFQLTPPAQDGGSWTRNVLYDFQGGSDGRNPQGSLLLMGGLLYGTTNIGGDVACSVNGGQGCGTIFKVIP